MADRPLPSSTTRLLPLVACALALAIPAAADAATSLRTTTLLSRAVHGGVPNGPSRHAAVSHDQRIARAIAYESDASDIVPGDVNGATDVFVVFRARPWAKNGSPWRADRTVLASRGLGGAPANGRSYAPALDGDSHHAPRCVAFVSDASNLVPGDTNGVADAFVRDLRSGRVVRVSVGADGRQADGPTTDVSVDGDCSRVAFTSSAGNLNLASTRRPAWLGARTTPGGGRRQVYVRVLRGGGQDRDLRGLTFLASATNRGQAGNGDAGEVAFARNGKSLVFSSTSSNLAAGDRNGVSDVFRRRLIRIRMRSGLGLQVRTRLVSGHRGHAGNGASSHPGVTDDGRYVVFQTDASDLLPGDSNGHTDVVESDLRGRRPRHAWVSRSHAIGQPGNGSSWAPVNSDAGEFVLFASRATNLLPSRSHHDPNGSVPDVFLWNRRSHNVSLESRGTGNDFLDRDSGDPATSSRGNYVPFETESTLLEPPGAFGLGSQPHQVYLRYLGPQ